MTYTTLQQIEKENIDLAVFLQKALCKEKKLPFPPLRPQEIECSRISISALHSLEAMKKLIKVKHFTFRGKGLFWNPFSKVHVKLQAERVSEEALFVSGQVQVDQTCYDIAHLDCIFHTEEISWAIAGHVLFSFPEELDISWLGIFTPAHRLLEGKEAALFVYKYKEDPPPGCPPIEWKGDYREKTQALEDVLPCLELVDARGAFANLHMEYGDKRIFFSDPKAFSGRNKEAERGWEKDLLETGYQRKLSMDSAYYCPTDLVAKSLSFLLEIGWKILDRQGRRIIRMENRQLHLAMEGSSWMMRGDFSFAKHRVNMAQVAGAFERREHFIDLSVDEVGWLGDPSVHQGIEDLVKEEKVGEGCRLRKAHFGVLQEISFTSIDAAARAALTPSITLEEDPYFQGKLWPYQEEGTKWLIHLSQMGFSGLLADEMGLGKTVQTMALLSRVSSTKPILIVVPTSLLFNWKKEWQQFLPHKKLYIYQGQNRGDLPFLQQQEAILTSYSYLRIDYALFAQLPCSYIILDEAQKIKNPDSQVARAAFALQGDRKICLTGTPVENRLDDLWSLLHFLEPSILGDRGEFLSKMAAAAIDSRYLASIQKKIRPFILRRKKEEVLHDLPPKIEQTIYVQMQEGQRDFYEGWLVKARQGLLRKVSLDGASAHRMEIFETILRLRQICVDPILVYADTEIESAKIERILTDIEEIATQKRKALVYSQFTSVLHIIRNNLAKMGIAYTYLDGQTKDREQVVNDFQQRADIPIFLISLQAGGVGLNLTAADYVLLVDPWWNEAVERQAMDRAHRLGRKEQVIVRRYICVDSIEEKMMKIKAHKTALSQGLFGTLQESFSAEQMIELLAE